MTIVAVWSAGLAITSFLLGYSVCHNVRSSRIRRAVNRSKQLLEQSNRLKQALRDGVHAWREGFSWTPRQDRYMDNWCSRVNNLTSYDNH